MDIHYDELTSADYEDVLALWQRTPGIGLHLDEADSRDGIAYYLRRNPGLSLVARDGGRVVGAVLCGHDGRRGFLNHLAVDVDYRGQGIGKAIVQRSLEALYAAGIAKCTILVYTDNADGQAFWTRQDWWTRDNLLVMQAHTREASDAAC